MTTWLLADIRSVQRYIFESDVLAQMRGASALIAGFDRTVREVSLLNKGTVEIGLGGTYRIAFANGKEATRTQAELRRRFEPEVGLPITRLTTVIVESSTDRSQAYVQLAEARSENVPVPSAPGGLVERCGICRRRPAATPVELPDSTLVLGCEVCAKRQEAARLSADPQPRSGRAAHQTRNLGEFARSSKPAGYIAVLVADGDAIGRLMMHASDDSALSGALQQATTAAVAAASAAADDRLIEQWVGGDDAVLVCRPQSALRCAAALVRTFHSEMENSGTTGVTMSCGVVVAHATMPFSNLLQLAEALLEESKSARRKEEEFGGAGFIAFETMTASAAAGLGGIRPYPKPPFEVSETAPCLLDHVDTVVRKLVQEGAARSLIRSLATLNDDGDAVDERIELADPDLLDALEGLGNPWTAVREHTGRLVQIHQLLLG